MSDPSLKKQIEQMRGEPIPTPKTDFKLKKQIERIRGEPIPLPKTPLPTEIKTIEDAQKAESYVKGASYEANRILNQQLKAITLQQQAIKDAEAKHQSIVSKRVGKKLTAKSKREYEKYLDEHIEYLKKAKGNLSASKENVDKINDTIKTLENQLKDLSAFKSKKGKIIEGAKQYKVTYLENGKSTSKTVDTIDKAEKFVEKITTPKPGPIQDLMRARIIKQTDLIDGKVYYALDKPVDKLTLGQRGLLEKAGFTLPTLGKKDSERYDNQLESTTTWLSNLIHADLVDKKEAEKIIKETEPIYLSTVKYGPDPVKEMIKKVNLKLADLEEKAKYKEYEGYTIAGLKPLPPEVVKARVAHITLSSAWGAVKATPFVVLGTTGGPIVSGLLAASMIATVANPQNQAMLKQYVREHPQQFVAELSGALALGYTAGQIKSLYNKYKHDIPDLYTQQLEMQLATDVPDFPSVRTEELHPWFEEVVFTKFVKELSAKDAMKFAKSADAVLYWGSGDEYGRPMSIFDLTQVHPELNDPVAIYLPNVRRLIPKYSDLILKVPGQEGIYVMPSVLAAMSLASQQGYITDADIETLLKSIEVQNINVNVDELKVPWTDEVLKDLTVPDVISVVDVVPMMVTTPIIVPITEPTVEPVFDFTPIEIPIEETILEEPIRIGLPKFDKVKMRKFRIQLFRGPKAKYMVDFHYRRMNKQSVTVEARSYPEALSRAQRVRRITQELPNMVDIRRVR